MSYSVRSHEPEKVHEVGFWDTPEVEPEPQREVRCGSCKGLGWVLVHDQETDCIDCEGYGSVVV